MTAERRLRLGRRLVRGTWSLTRCPAPVRTTSGVLRCVTSLDRCVTPSHRRWDRARLPLAVVWSLRPWWPNRLGRAQDRGTAHTPLVAPCRYCDTLTARGVPRTTVILDHEHARRATQRPTQ